MDTKVYLSTRNVTSYIHRMVGEAWIPIPQTYIDLGYTIDTLTIDHINNRQDNRIRKFEDGYRLRTTSRVWSK